MGSDPRKIMPFPSEALDFVKSTVSTESIACNLQENTAYLYASDENDAGKIEKEYEAAKSVGIEAELLRNPDFPVENFAMTGYKNQAVFHPVRYVESLASAAAAKGAVIYGNTKAIEVVNGDIVTVRCEDGITVKAKHIVQATQYPIYDGPNLFFARLYPKRTYGIAALTKRDWPEGSYITVGKPTRSFRTHIEDGRRILIAVGDGHDTGRGNDDKSDHFEHLMQFADKLAGVREVLAMWSAQDYESPDLLPYIGRISDHSNIYVAAGFRKWGLTNGTLAGLLLAELITTGKCRNETLYSRTRPDLMTSPGKTIYGAVAPVVELIKSKVEETGVAVGLKPGEGRVIHFRGERAGIYRDSNDEVTILDISCTHMGTALNFNSAEKTWDCPAHGGRYSTDGKLLEGPPKDPLKVLFRGKYDDLFKEE